MSEDGEEWMVVGRVTGSFGIKGDLKVEPLTDFPERFAELREIFLGPDHQRYLIERTRPHQKHILVKLSGIETPEAAAGLSGREASIPRSDAVVLPEGHYYLDDLIGIQVESIDGRDLGRIADVLRTGSNDVYVVRGAAGEILVPGTRDGVAELNVPARRLVVEAWILEPER